MSKARDRGKGVCGPAFLMCSARPSSFLSAATSTY